MAQLNILTTQNVVISYETASIGDRVLARLLDWLILIVYSTFIFIILSRVAFNISGGVWVLLLLPVLTYDVWCETLFSGRSFGKMILKLRVVKVDGSMPGIGDYMTRWLLRLLEGVLSASPGLALLVMLINGKGQRIGDILAGTAVVKTTQNFRLHDTILMQMHPQYNIVFPQVSILSDHDVNTVKDVLKQALVSKNYPAIERLAARIRELMGVNPPIPSLQFLHIVLNDYTHYSFEK